MTRVDSGSVEWSYADTGADGERNKTTKSLLTIRVHMRQCASLEHMRSIRAIGQGDDYLAWSIVHEQQLNGRTTLLS